ncbi:MAG: hypothetical protein AABY64_00525 [Bdellovibrionota bacterium]
MDFSIKEIIFKLFLFLFSFLLISASTEPKIIKKKSDAHWSRLMTIMRQLDSIDREVWWVLVAKRPPLTQSLFGKVLRAAQTTEGQKLTQKQLFSCDKYSSQRKILTQLGYPQKISMFSVCRKSQDLFVEIDWPNKNQLNMVFNPEPLSDVLGLSASILGKKIICEVRTDDQAIVQSYSCKNMIKNKDSSETVELDIYEFEKKKENQLTLKGNVTEQLKIKRKIETTVPLSGKIIVTETEIAPPAGYRRKIPGAKPPVNKAPVPIVAPAPPVIPTPPITPGQDPLHSEEAVPLNPDVLVQKVIEEHNLKMQGTPPLAEPEYIEEGAEEPPPLQNPTEPSRR